MYLLEFAGEDDGLALAEARTAVEAGAPLGPGLARARSIDRQRVLGLAFTRRASELVGHAAPTLEDVRVLLDAATIDRTGSVAVRARDVRGTTGIDTLAVERALGDVLVDRGFTVDLEAPDHVLRAVFTAGPRPADRPGRPDAGTNGRTAGEVDGVSDGERNGEADGERTEDVALGVLGWLTVESRRDFGPRAPTEKPFFQPGSMDPLLARAVANLAGAGPDVTLLDPMCGTAGLLIEGGLVGASVVGLDAQRKMVAGARRNLRTYLEEPAAWQVIRGDATALPLRADAVDGVVFDAPYGRQSPSPRHERMDLITGALAEAHRVAPRGVVVADEPLSAACVDAGWSVRARFERYVHRSLTRHLHVLSRADA